MSLEQNKEIVRRQFQLISAGDTNGAAALFAPVSFNHGREVDRETISKVVESLVALREQFMVHEIIAEGDWVACRVMVTGKHDVQSVVPVDSGIHSVVKPTGLPYTFQYIHMFKVLGGQIVEHWANRDDLGAARQLGLDPGPSAAGLVVPPRDKVRLRSDRVHP